MPLDTVPFLAGHKIGEGLQWSNGLDLELPGIGGRAGWSDVPPSLAFAQVLSICPLTPFSGLDHSPASLLGVAGEGKPKHTDPESN